MEIFVASTSFHKISATEEAGHDVFEKIHVEGKNTKSGVNAQPETKDDDDETLRGACNRLDDLKQIIGETRYDFLIAFENGIKSKKIGDRTVWFDYGWIVVEDAEGNRYYSTTTGIEIDSDIVEEARRRGFETTTIGDVIAERLQSNPTDPHETLTNYLVKRSEMLRDGLKLIFGKLKKAASNHITT